MFPIEIKSKTNFTVYDCRGLKSFRDTYKDQDKDGVIIYVGKECYKLNLNDTAIPWNSVYRFSKDIRCNIGTNPGKLENLIWYRRSETL